MNGHALEIVELTEVLRHIAQYARSPLGTDEVLGWKPFNAAEPVRTRLREIDEIKLLKTRAAFSFDDVRTVITPVEYAAGGGQLGVSELFDVAMALRVVQNLRTALTEYAADVPTLAAHLVQLPEELDQVTTQLTDCISDRERMRDDASTELSKYRRQQDKLGEQIRSKLSAVLQSSQMKKYLQDAQPTLRDGRHVISVQQRFAERISGTQRGQSTSGASVFIEPEQITLLENELSGVNDAEKAEMERLLWKLSGAIAENAPMVSEAFRTTAYFDAILAASTAADAWGLVPPEIVETGPLKLDQARNPLLIALAVENGDNPEEIVVPMTLRLGDSFDCLVITGPNTGGKTVALKTTGLCVGMALTGLPIPAGDESSVPLYRDMWADIGDEQSMQQSLSTFSAHLQRIVEAVDGAGEGTLVLLDELGSGTDPTEGAALGEAILRELLERDAQIVATTHLGQLKQFGHAHPRAENGSVGFDPDTLEPTYELSIGTPGSSHALHVARRMGLVESILDAARETLERDENKELDEVIAEVQRAKREMAVQKREMTDERQQLRSLHDEAEQRLTEAERSAQRDEGPLIALLRRVADDVGTLAAGGRSSRSELRAALNEIRERILDEVPQTTSGATDSKSPSTKKNAAVAKNGQPVKLKPSVGDMVHVKSLNKTMEIISLDAKRGKVQVAQGIMKTTVSIAELRPPRR
jgi:DNA mismatch repair protein MutS2